MQSGLAQAPPKTNRKLRKERKNRAKKVRFTRKAGLVLDFTICLVPWHQEDEGCGAPQEGWQVDLLLPVFQLSHLVYPIRRIGSAYQPSAKAVLQLYLTRMLSLFSISPP